MISFANLEMLENLFDHWLYILLYI